MPVKKFPKSIAKLNKVCKKRVPPTQRLTVKEKKQRQTVPALKALAKKRANK